MTRPAPSGEGSAREELSRRLELLRSREELDAVRRLLRGARLPSSWPASNSPRLADAIAALLADQRELVQVKSSYRYRLASAIAGVTQLPRRLARQVVGLARGLWRSRDRLALPIGRQRISTSTVEPSEHEQPVSVPLPGASPRLASGLRVAAVLDPFSAAGLANECSLELLHPGQWAEQVRLHEPHMLLVESAWVGRADEWAGRVQCAQGPLRSLVMSCRAAGIPTVFWNKEDPLHFRAFLETAALFDHVLTTDADSVPRYRRLLGHDRVGVMMFAVQPTIHHPVAEEDRQPSSVFAGAWYGRLARRSRDFMRSADALSLAGPLVIHDRNDGRGQPHQRFPRRFRQRLRPSVSYEETGDLFRRHVIGLTLNTVKSSPTMFARRALELAACGTSVYSNHCLALHLLLGDGVIASDTPERLLKEAWGELRAPGAARYRRRRLRALRSVMRDHTWARRVQQLGKVALGVDLRSGNDSCAVVARVHDSESLRLVCESFQHQVAVTSLVLDAPAALAIPAFAKRLECFDPTSVQWIALFHCDDHYGPHYLSDFMMASRWDLGDVIGKSAWHELRDGHLVEHHAKDEYRLVDALALRRMMFRSGSIPRSLSELLDDIDAGFLSAPRCVSTDAWEYLHGGAGSKLAATLIVRCAATVGADQLERASSLLPAQPDPALAGQHALDASQLAAIMANGVPAERMSIAHRRGGVEVCSLLDAGEAAELRSAPISRRRLEINGQVRVCVQAPSSSALALRIEAIGSSGRTLDTVVMPPRVPVTLASPGSTSHYELVIKSDGPTVEEVDGIWIGTMPASPLVAPGRSRLALVCNGYPADGNLYRNAFLHRRVLAYRARGVGVDVFVVRPDPWVGDYEFDGVIVRGCLPDVLGATLARSGHAAVAVHFLDEAIWGAIRQVDHQTPVTVWLHGAEVQSWRHRHFNYSTQSQREMAESDSVARARLWREVLQEQRPKLHFVAVSSYLAEQTWMDLGIRPPDDRWSVVHNPIDTQLFRYQAKRPSLAKKILSIRPHASRIYANDLVAATILRLADEAIFPELQFTLVGDGELWSENFRALESFPNVTLMREFVSQEDIAELHREHGVFLVPTRGDTQGVSRDEAMSSGLVPVSNDIAAVPEFVDASCGELCPPEDVGALASAILRIATNPDRFASLSARAADRVRRQSGSGHVVDRELSVLGFSEVLVDGCCSPFRPDTTNQVTP